MGRTKTRTSRWIVVILLLSSFSFFYNSVAMPSTDVHASSPEAAEEGGDGEDHDGDRSRDFLDLLKRFLSFTVMVIILAVLFKKFGVKEMLTTRIREIRQRLEDLEEEKSEMQSKYREAERKLRDFESERQDIIEQFKKEGKAEKERIIAEAQQRSEQILKQAELMIEREMQSAKNRLRQGVIDLAAQRAGEIMAKELTDKDQDRLVNEFIERVGKNH
jgi:F-type H+-transporting ATPase subunit b